MYSGPITGASGRVLLSHLRFLLAAPGFYSRFVDIQAFHHLPALWMQQGNATRPFMAFALFGCWLCSCFVLTEERTNKNALHPLARKDEERYLQLSWYHLHSLTPHDINLVEY